MYFIFLCSVFFMLVSKYFWYMWEKFWLIDLVYFESLRGEEMVIVVLSYFCVGFLFNSFNSMLLLREKLMVILGICGNLLWSYFKKKLGFFVFLLW